MPVFGAGGGRHCRPGESRQQPFPGIFLAAGNQLPARQSPSRSLQIEINTTA